MGWVLGIMELDCGADINGERGKPVRIVEERSAGNGRGGLERRHESAPEVRHRGYDAAVEGRWSRVVSAGKNRKENEWGMVDNNSVNIIYWA